MVKRILSPRRRENSCPLQCRIDADAEGTPARKIALPQQMTVTWN
jgi:hypothetical protein